MGVFIVKMNGGLKIYRAPESDPRRHVANALTLDTVEEAFDSLANGIYIITRAFDGTNRIEIWSSADKEFSEEAQDLIPGETFSELLALAS